MSTTTQSTNGSTDANTGTINITPEYITGGHAIFTVANPQDEHYTYRVTTPRDQEDDSVPDAVWFIGVLAGPQNTRDYRYLGIVVRKNGGFTVKWTKASKFTEDSKAFKVAKWAVEKVSEGGSVPTGYSIIHNGHCGRCGRTLTDPESIRTGIGPVCAER